MPVTVFLDAPAGGIVDAPAAPVRGWLAADAGARIEAVSLRSDAGEVVPLALVERPDVRAAHPARTTSGFAGWIDARIVPAGAWHLQYETAAESGSVPLGLRVDGTWLESFGARKAAKLRRVRPLLICPLCRTELADADGELRCAHGHRFTVTGDAYAFTDHGALPGGSGGAGGVSSHGYDAILSELIASAQGPVLDVGAGLRPEYRDDVINLEIVPYPTTDVIANSDALPFADGAFDLVISVAVLEHVRDPFAAARELVRVLRPGGRVFAAVPFLQPYHGYPHHYYNMTAAGLRNLFPALAVEQLAVPASGHPLFALTWMLRDWLEALPPETARAFARMTVGELSGDPAPLLGEPFAQLPPRAMEMLGALNVIVARKPLDS